MSILMVPGVHYIIRLIYCTIGRCEDCARNEASLALTLYERVAVGRKNLSLWMECASFWSFECLFQISYTACLTCIFQRQLFIAVSQSKVCQKQCRTIRHHILLYNLTVFWVGSQGSSWGVVARLIVGVRAINEWAARPNITVQSESATIFCRTIRLYAESPVKADCWCPTVSDEWAARPSNLSVSAPWASATIFCRTIKLYAESPVKADCWCLCNWWMGSEAEQLVSVATLARPTPDVRPAFILI